MQGLLVKPWVWVNGRNHRVKYSLKKKVTFNASIIRNKRSPSMSKTMVLCTIST